MDEQKQKKKKEEPVAEEATQEQENVVSPEEVVKKTEFDAMQQLATQMQDQAKRLAADYQNLQRRVQEEKSVWIRSANKDLILKFLPILDTLFLANKHLQDKGLALAIDQFSKLLEQEGIKRIETIGKDFDPVLMEAVSTIAGEKGKVVEEARAGYLLYDTVIRSAQVIVGA